MPEMQARYQRGQTGMMVRKNDREIVLQCDECGEVFYADSTDIAAARLMADAHGWKYGLDDEHTVTDYCPKCAPKL